MCTRAPRLQALLSQLTRSLAPRAPAGAARHLHTSQPLLRGTKNLGWYYRALAQAERDKARGAAPPPFPEAPLHGRARARLPGL